MVVYTIFIIFQVWNSFGSLGHKGFISTIQLSIVTIESEETRFPYALPPMFTAHVSIFHIKEKRSRSQYINWLRAGRYRGPSSSPGRVKNYLFSTSSRLNVGLLQPPVQWVLGHLSGKQRGRCLKRTTRLQLIPRSSKRGSIHPLPHTSSRRSD
jgi:hypothetical protein